VALAVEPPERNIMRRRPFHPKESIFSRGLGPHLIWVGLVMAAVSLVMGYYYWADGRADWHTMVFTTLTFSQMAHVLAIRAGNDSLFTVGLFSNTPLFLSVVGTFVLQFAVVYIPIFQNAFGTVGLPAEDLAISILLASIVFWVVEVEKLVVRRRIARQAMSV
jgi:P-type Ca2+ transporter type 2C